MSISLVLGLFALGVNFVTKLQGGERTAAIAVLGAGGLAVGWYVHRVRRLQRMRRSASVPIHEWKEKGLGVKGVDEDESSDT